MTAVQTALGWVRGLWTNVPFQRYTRWLGYGIGIDGQGAHIAIFSRTADLPLPLRLLVKEVGEQRYQVLVDGRGIEVRVIVAGRFVGLGAGTGVVVPEMVGAGGRVMASWREGDLNKTGPAGTIGAILRRAGDAKPWLLSANHVIAVNCMKDNRDLTVHLTDGGTPGEAIGTEVQCIRITSAACTADAAAVRIDLPKERIVTAHPSGLRSRTPFVVSGNQTAGAENVVFRKAGGFTNETTSRFVAIEATLFVDLDFRGNVELTGQIVAEPFADEGDSGSLAVETVSGGPVGLVVAAAQPPDLEGKRITVISPIGGVLGALRSGFELVLPGEAL